MLAGCSRHPRHFPAQVHGACLRVCQGRGLIARGMSRQCQEDQGQRHRKLGERHQEPLAGFRKRRKRR